MDEQLKLLSRCFDSLQKLDIKSSQNNIEIILQCLYDLKDVYNAIKEGAKDERNTIE